jgi:hypothetical protein
LRFTTHGASRPATESSPSFKACLSMPANPPAKRGKTKGVGSRVSTKIVAHGVFHCVPPRSAQTGIAGGATGASCPVPGERRFHQPWSSFLHLSPLSTPPSLPTHTRGGVHREWDGRSPVLSSAGMVGSCTVAGHLCMLPRGCPAPDCCAGARNCSGEPIPVRAAVDASR